MYPILFQYEGFFIPAWHFFLVLGALATYYLMQFLNRKYDLIEDDFFLLKLFLLVYPVGYLGARGLSIFLVEQNKYPSIGEKLSALLVLGPMTLYGAVIIVFVAGAVFIKYSRQSFKDCLDLVGPSWLVGVALGRVGCFLNGDDYGWPLTLSSWEQRPWWSVSFPNLNDLQNHVARYPVQIYEVLYCLIFSFVLFYCFPKIRRYFSKGAVGVFSLVLYGVGRFINEFYRADFRGSLFSDVLSPAQIISLAIVISSLIYLFIFSRQHSSSLKDSESL